MAQPKKQGSLTCNLMDLPDAAVNTIIASLTEPDRIGIMAACRKTFHMALLSAEARLRITNYARFAGVKKVLNSSPAQIHLEIICPSADKDVNAGYQTPLSALAVLMGLLPENYSSQLAASCHWQGITKVTIQATMMQCLVPPFIAAACPQLQQLKIMRPRGVESWNKELFITEHSAGQELSLCSSLTQLEIHDHTERPLVLPPPFHDPVDLRQNLPNINTLILTVPSNDLIQAFATQLTRLELGTTRVTDLYEEVQQPIRQCLNLQYLRIPVLFLPDNKAALKVLEYNGRLTDDEFGKLMQLPSLTELRLLQLVNVHKNWSKHECSWQTLHVQQRLGFATLANINLSNLKELSIGPDVVVDLPDPAEPNSLAAVQQAANNLARLGQIGVMQRIAKKDAWAGGRGSINWRIGGDSDNHEQQAAEFINIAAQSIIPCKKCNCEFILGRPLLENAVFSWMHFESLCLGEYRYISTDVWQAVQQLPRLNTVVLWSEEYSTIHPSNEATAQDLISISGAVCSAAKHYVIPTNKRLRIEVADRSVSFTEPKLTEARTFLEGCIQEIIASLSALSSSLWKALHPSQSMVIQVTLMHSGCS